MLVIVGSKNPVKINAAKNAFAKYFKKAKIEGIETASRVREQPIDIEEILQGAKNRAKKAFESKECDFGVGIEAGIFQLQGTNSGWLDTACVAIFDGKKFHLGFTPMFEYPKKIVETILAENCVVGEAVEKVFREKTDKQKEGAVGWLTKGKMPRTKYIEQGVIMALIGIVRKEFFE